MRAGILPDAGETYSLLIPTPRILHPDKSGFQNDRQRIVVLCVAKGLNVVRYSRPLWIL